MSQIGDGLEAARLNAALNETSMYRIENGQKIMWLNLVERVQSQAELDSLCREQLTWIFQHNTYFQYVCPRCFELTTPTIVVTAKVIRGGVVVFESRVDNAPGSQNQDY